MTIDSNNFLDSLLDLTEINAPKSWPAKARITKQGYLDDPAVADSLISQKEIFIEFLTHLGSPQNKFKVIHVSGTSGKGSTCTLTSRILTQNGIQNGLFITPFVYNIREVFQINSSMISQENLDKYATKFIKLTRTWLESTSIWLTYHELIFAFSCYLFDMEKVKIAVIECFMGGRFDNTNIFTRPDKTCVITAIGKDHEQFLGDTTEDIVWHKSGIIQSNNTLILGNNLTQQQKKLIKTEAIIPDKNIHNVQSNYHIQTSKNDDGVKIINYTWHKQSLEWDLKPDQIYLLPNLATALLGAEMAIKPQLFDLNELDYNKILGPLPARLELKTIYRNQIQTQIILDGAHNQQKIGFLRDRLVEIDPKQKYIVLFSSGKGDQILDMLKILKPISHSIIASTFQIKLKDNRKIKESVQLLQSEEILLAHKYIFETDPEKALKLAIKEAAETSLPILCTGSFYFVGVVNECLEF